MMQHPHHAKASPKFCKSYSSVGVTINDALRTFRQEVRTNQFPSPKYSPYKMAAGQSVQQCVYVYAWQRT